MLGRLAYWISAASLGYIVGVTNKLNDKIVFPNGPTPNEATVINKVVLAKIAVATGLMPIVLPMIAFDLTYNPRPGNFFFVPYEAKLFVEKNRIDEN